MAEPAGPETADAEGNTRLTSVTGMLLLVLLAVEGVTILRVRQLITLHIYLGIILLGPVVLKTASTVYRFARYYTGAPAYVAKGPPHPVLRILGPLVILSSFAVLGTGVGLLFDGNGRGGTLLTLHRLSFFLWFAVMAVHVIGHLREAAVESAHELRSGPPRQRRARTLRVAVVAIALVAGVGTAAMLWPHASGWTSRDDSRPASSGQPRSG